MSNPFYLSEDDDDTVDSSKVNPKKNFFDDCYDEDDETKNKINEISRLQNSVLNRTKYCNQVIQNSENIGNLTSQELDEQREQLKRIDQNMSHLNANLNVSQKHINSLKSFFGSVTNYFGSNKKDPNVDLSKNYTPVAMGVTLPTTKTGSLNIPNLPARPVFGLDQNQGNSLHHNNSSPFLISGVLNNGIMKKKDFDVHFNQDLDDMSCGMTRLKELAINMNQELENQNVLIDSHIMKADQASSRITQQNKQMKKILGGK